jgi:5-deoxy-glucuronate isomerase
LILGPELPTHAGETGKRELTLDVFSGTVSVEGTAASQPFRFDRVGGRDSAFSAPPEMVYLPPDCRFTIRAKGGAKLGIFAAPSTPRTAPAYVPAEEALRITVGKGNWTRNVVTSIGNNIAAERLIVGETLNPPGNWSSAPPHKHDRHSGDAEVPMEEIYYFHIDPPQGFAMMRLYTAPDDPEPFDEAVVVEDGDTVLIPRGYHPVAAAPGYRVHYTWGMAGEARRYGAWTEDPKHAWVKTASV